MSLFPLYSSLHFLSRPSGSCHSCVSGMFEDIAFLSPAILNIKLKCVCALEHLGHRVKSEPAAALNSNFLFLHVIPLSVLQGSKKKNLNKQEMSKYLRFIVQRMKERVRTTIYLFLRIIFAIIRLQLIKPPYDNTADCCQLYVVVRWLFSLLF